MSSIRAELYAVLEAFNIVAPLHNNVYFIVDSQAALYVFQSTSSMDCDLVNECLDLIHAQESAGATVISHGYPLMWVSHLMKRQTPLPNVPFKTTTQWTLALSTLWAMLRVALINDLVHSISDQLELCCLLAVAVVFTMYVSPRAVLIPMGDTPHHTTWWQ
ncbi:hypothetical protein E2C01_057014 [Portunus trituberculatus]|uniref:Uncharacterized protein n=1 Tax=Portunus trituberculatus TaxID=210409 RepID=A0A5B7GYX3_PORTR|nr:hypothetical protein [Portunus trituberculatus]